MRTLLTLCALIVACGPAARAQDEPSPAGQTSGVAPAVEMPVEATGTGIAPAPMMMPHALPHYYGRGEWPGFGGCGNGHGCGVAPGPGCGAACGHSACEGATWGCCPRPCNAHLHLWDTYCHEVTPCPACGFRLGSLMHYLRCECRNQSCGGCTVSSGGCACGGCADRGSPVNGLAAPEPRPAGDEAAPPAPPMPPGEEKQGKSGAKPEATKPGAKKDTPPPPDMNEKTGKEPKKAYRVVPGPRNANLLDRLFPWSSGSR